MVPVQWGLGGRRASGVTSHTSNTPDSPSPGVKGHRCFQSGKQPFRSQRPAPSTEHRAPSTEYQAPSTEYHALTHPPMPGSSSTAPSIGARNKAQAWQDVGLMFPVSFPHQPAAFLGPRPPPASPHWTLPPCTKSCPQTSPVAFRVINLPSGTNAQCNPWVLLPPSHAGGQCCTPRGSSRPRVPPALPRPG